MRKISLPQIPIQIALQFMKQNSRLAPEQYLIFLLIICYYWWFHYHMSLNLTVMQVDLTEYMEKHEFVFDAVLNEEVSNDEVSTLYRDQYFFPHKCY